MFPTVEATELSGIYIFRSWKENNRIEVRSDGTPQNNPSTSNKNVFGKRRVGKTQNQRQYNEVQTLFEDVLLQLMSTRR